MEFGLIAVLILGLLFFINRARAQSGNYKNINTDEFAELMNDKNSIILDVRTPAEVKSGKIKGARVVNLFGSDFLKKIKEFDKSKTYLIYCRSGNRSGQACSLMEKEGFEHLYNLTGGYGAWSRR